MSEHMKIIERTQISPPLGSVPTTDLRLTFFDYPWLFCPPIQRLFFFQLPHPFTQTTLATLKSSLSLTLRFFFPLAAKLSIPPQPPLKPHIIYTQGDSILLTVAESSADFHRITSHHPLPCEELYDFMPELPPAQEIGDGTRIVSVLAVQVTLFPDSGICIAITFNHVIGDGRSMNDFVKSWASVFRGDLGFLERSPPFCDKNVIREDEDSEVEEILLKESWDWGLKPVSNWTEQDFSGKVRVRLVMDEVTIKKLKHWFAGLHSNIGDLQISGFAAISAVVWRCLIKSQEKRSEKKEVCHLAFVADCRSRPEFKIPEKYFGNCLAVSIVSIKRSDLVGEIGLGVAGRAIAEEVRELGKGRLREMEGSAVEWRGGECGWVAAVAGVRDGVWMGEGRENRDGSRISPWLFLFWGCQR